MNAGFLATIDLCRRHKENEDQLQGQVSSFFQTGPEREVKDVGYGEGTPEKALL